MAWHEWPLVVFTVLAQTAVGAFIIMSVINLTISAQEYVKDTINRKLFFVLVVLGFGFMASMAHLGSPFRAFNAMNRVGHSWLSNEIFTGSLFFATAGFYWLLSFLDKGALALRRGLMIIAMLIGLSFMYSMVNVYLIDTVPTWNNIYTWLMFGLTMVISGGILAHILVTLSLDAENEGHDALLQSVLKGMVSIATVAVIIVNAHQQISLHEIHSAIHAADELVPNLAFLQTCRALLLVAGVMLWFFSVCSCSKPRKPISLSMALLGFGLVVVSELLSRSLFFGLHMTVGI